LKYAFPGTASTEFVSPGIIWATRLQLELTFHRRQREEDPAQANLSGAEFESREDALRSTFEHFAEDPSKRVAQRCAIKVAGRVQKQASQ